MHLDAAGTTPEGSAGALVPQAAAPAPAPAAALTPPSAAPAALPPPAALGPVATAGDLLATAAALKAAAKHAPLEPWFVACRFWDRECSGHLEQEDLEDILLAVCSHISSARSAPFTVGNCCLVWPAGCPHAYDWRQRRRLRTIGVVAPEALHPSCQSLALTLVLSEAGLGVLLVRGD